MNNILKTIIKEEIGFINKEIKKNDRIINSCKLEKNPVFEENIENKIKEKKEYEEMKIILIKKLNGHKMNKKEVVKFEEKFINIQKKLKKSLKMAKRLDNFN